MLPRNHPDRIQIAFDDHRLVANGTGAARGPGEASSVRRMALPAQGFAGRPRRWPTSRDMARP